MKFKLRKGMYCKDSTGVIRGPMRYLNGGWDYIEAEFYFELDGTSRRGDDPDLVSECLVPHLTFIKLSDAEQGALLLEAHRGGKIQRFWHNSWKTVNPKWDATEIYRIAPPRIPGTVEISNGHPDFTTWQPI